MLERTLARAGLLLALLLAPLAAGADPCATSARGLALAGEPGPGGATPAGGEDGIGGTGLRGPEDGIGGTGIFGELTAFGSICVNGLHVHYEQDVAVEINGEPGSTAGLEIGQVVWVEARPANGGFATERIEVWSAVIGAIGEVRPAERQLEVAGIVVDVLDGSLRGVELPDLRVGDSVDVSGLWAGDRRVAATRIVRLAPGTSRKLVGPRVRDLLARTRDLAGAVVEGIVVDRPQPGELDLGGLVLDVADAGGPAREARPGARVRATGRLLPDGRLRLVRPAARPPRAPAPGERPIRSPRSDERLERPQRPERPERPERPDRIDLERHDFPRIQDAL
jgi:hypothetical protein